MPRSTIKGLDHRVLAITSIKQASRRLSSGAMPLPVLVTILVAILSMLATTATAQQKAGARPLPRFASLKSSPVNLRTGPGRRYPKAWVFRRAGLPVEIIQEQQGWRRVRDAEGASGWVLGALLSRRRTALVLPWERAKRSQPKRPQPVYADLKQEAASTAASIARLEAGTLATVKSCDRQWCHLSVGSFTGYLPQNALWGVYPDEYLE